MQNIEEILNIINQKNLNVSEISRRTGIPVTRIYKWLDDRGRPKAEDAEKMKLWAAKHLEVVPNIPPLIPESGKETILAEPSPMQILDRLSKAFIDQAEGFKTQAHAFALHVELMKQIKEEMARAQTQTIMNANLVRTLTGVEVLNQDSQKLLKLLNELTSAPKADGDPLSQGVGKKVHQIGGDGKKPGKHRG